MTITIREGLRKDATDCGRICYEAFAAIAGAHNFAPDFPNIDAATGVLSSLLGRASFYGVVAVADGKIVGSNFLDLRSIVAGIGPVTVDPRVQNGGIGARLMHAVLDHAAQKGVASVRLVQAGYHCRSLSLYMKLGFDVREHLACMQGPPLKRAIDGCHVRAATAADIGACDALYRSVHGFSRIAELRDAVARGTAKLVERNGRITGYTTIIAFFGHAVGETTDDVKALIAAADAFVGAGILIPSRNGELMRWLLGRGLRMTQPLTLMSTGLYSEPKGAWLPSILY